jgi:methylase of polypeptide subunit release factors
VTATYAIVNLGGIDVCFTEELDGGGARYGQDYVPFVTRELGRQGRAFEWCAGPGFIGFSLLGHGLVESLCLADLNPAAVEACRETIRRNGLDGVVDVYESDCLDGIAASERWDLVVGNPPHSGSDEVRLEIKRPPMVYQDVGWQLHERFYATVGAHLAPGGNVVIQENLKFSSPETFQPMVDRNGLRFVESALCETPEGNSLYYYVWSTIDHADADGGLRSRAGREQA